ncbi:50S ribosomal protein L11 methyltransferase [Lacticigenium naphthae]|uniref:50S ribosomal protein L11 methyltransferase n=1 Tax=Lacticigenium naphthae TaxID=515351 RepID=UPI00040BECFF|nr:50S ribosomal protein L11 methyltransferase [Lacticigenium naphthae]
MTAWNELNLLISEEAAEVAQEWMIEAGSNGIVIQDRNDFLNHSDWDSPDTLWDLNEDDFPAEGILIKGYFIQNIDLEKIIEELSKKIENLKVLDVPVEFYSFSSQKVDEKNWAESWKKYYNPVRVTHYITIVPQWKEYQPETKDERIVRLDPGLAFGTGTHPTTQLSIQALETYLRGGEVVMDIGTGSGVLSIVSDLLGAKTVKAYDLDEVAVKSASDNVQLNSIKGSITIKTNNLLNGVNEKVDLIVANILAEVIEKLIPDAYVNLKSTGLFITSGIIEDKKERILLQLKQEGFEILQILQMKDWFTIVAKK